MLEIRNLSYVTPEGKVILDDINLTVKTDLQLSQVPTEAASPHLQE